MFEFDAADVELAPATSAQRGLWLTYLLDESSTAYHVPHAFRLIGDPDVPALRHCLAALCQRHEALRTSFLVEGDELFQVIRTAVDPTAVLDCVAIPETVSLAAAVAAEFAAPFDLSGSSLFRARLLTHADGGHALTFVAHHTIVDAQSMAILWAELSQLYGAAVRDQPAELAEPPLQPGDYAAWEQQWIAGPGYARQVEFFRERLAGAPRALDLPLAGGTGLAWAGGLASVEFDAVVTSQLLSIAGRSRATPFMALLTLFAGVLHRWSGQETVVVGTSMSVREEPGLERAVGMFVNSVPLPTSWADDPPYEEALGRVRDTVLACLAQRRCPFDRLVADLRPARDPQRSPVFQVMFGLDTAVPAELTLDGLLVEPVRLPVRTAKFELTLDIALAGDVLRCDLEWSNQYFTAEAAACLVEHLAQAARQVVADPDTRVGQWLPEVDRPAAPPGAGLGDDGQLAAAYPALPIPA